MLIRYLFFILSSFCLINVEQKDRTLLIRNTNRTNLSRLSLMDYPDSPNVCLKSRQMSAVDSVSRNSSDNNHGVVDYDDRINTATFASSLCSSNLADSGFVTIRRPKQPSRLTIINSDSGDVANNRFSLTSAGLLSSLDNSNNKAKNSPKQVSPKVDTIDNRHLDNNRSNSRTLTPHTTEVTSPCIPRRSLNMVGCFLLMSFVFMLLVMYQFIKIPVFV